MSENSPAAAEVAELGARGLAFIAGRPDLTAALLEASGADPASLRRMAGQPEFGGFVLDFLLADDRRLLDFAAAEGLAPEAIMHARARLEAGL
ncbi:DUF3572 family protein [Paracoccus sp. S-4012]|uniref:DUF3572 family protein n=1 Tax=Paracoccus sp. S-4012 TaxID=2665648 RepID=UPI0012B11A69|nr:DUF3572 family protein [Paracoccus sp. S-4012]MRX51265.1 DUF3572 family protein [Paracoccus sp. S-4012]